MNEEEEATADAHSVKIEIHADLICPWCYAQKRSLDAAIARSKAKHPEVNYEVAWKPFLLTPPKVKHCDKYTLYATKIGADKVDEWWKRIQAVGTRYGIAFTLAGKTGSSLASQTLVSLVLRRIGPAAQGRVIDRLFAGNFEGGRDITDEDWLVELGRGEGLDETEVRAVLHNKEATGLVEREAGMARRDHGVEAVPCVTIQDRYRVGGFQETAVFDDLFERLRGVKCVHGDV